MLFGYPIAAITDNNWFHEALLAILQSINSALQNGEPLPVWIEMFPEHFRERILGRGAFGERINAYIRVVESLSPDGIERLTRALIDQNEIDGLLTNRRNCEKLSAFPEKIQKPVKEMYAFAFGLLSELEIRDRQYEIIYNAIPAKLCPFCGLEIFSKPGMRRESLDHYLAEHIYTFAGTNLNNLVPMCHTCNSSYKLQKDMIFDRNGNRRTAIFPYNHTAIHLSLTESDPFDHEESTVPQPRWQIDFSPYTNEVETWDCVFEIRRRYKENVLDAKFLKWIGGFGAWCTNRRPVEDIVLVLAEYSELQATICNIDMGDSMFLKAAVFEMLSHHCQLGNRQLITFLARVANGEIRMT